VQGYGSKTLRVYLVDDHDIVRRGLRDVLAAARDVVVVGESHSARAAAPAIVRQAPDVMLLDVQLQDGTGIHVCRRVRSANPAVRGLLLTSVGDDEAQIAAVLADAAGYLVKVSAGAEIVPAVRHVGAGKSLIEDSDRDRVIDQVRIAAAPESAAFSEVERELLGHVLDGLPNHDIARRMQLSEDELDHHLGVVVERMTGVRSPRDGVHPPRAVSDD
jgi:DNA-binding NarL/FixJ family response regulator